MLLETALIVNMQLVKMLNELDLSLRSLILKFFLNLFFCVETLRRLFERLLLLQQSRKVVDVLDVVLKSL